MPQSKQLKKVKNIDTASNVLNKLIYIKHPGQKFAYLRKIDYFVFEELILNAMEELGHTVVRNSRYTGDGGIDGRVTINGHNYIIQAKRYKDHIRAKDINDFLLICKKNKLKGLFIHTGKTGKLAKYRGNDKFIDIISGERMLALVTAHHFYPRGTFRHFIEKNFGLSFTFKIH